jgi:hypothetical protein
MGDIEKSSDFVSVFATAMRSDHLLCTVDTKPTSTVPAIRHDRSLHGGHVMNFVAAALLVLSGLFYAADHHEIGTLGDQMCRYGSTFCDNPAYVFVGAILAALWGTFVSMR